VNNGQTCSATSRLLVPRAELAEIEERLAALVSAMVVGDPLDPATEIGPVASLGQQQSILRYLDKAGDDGVFLAGGSGPVPGLDRGYYVRPSVVSRLEPNSVLAQEEIFGPVLSVLAYDDIDQAVQIANDSDYGLSGAVWSSDVDASIAIARRLRTGQVAINGGRFNLRAPFGGFKRSGVGRELGPHGLLEYFELTSLQLPAGSAT
jgi:aldehyde dehydrogenase (NAD+)